MLDSTAIDAAADFDSFFAAASAPIIRSASHFTTDCLWIVDHAQRSADSFPGISALVLLSIQQPFSELARAMPDVAANGFESRYLWGFKPKGLAYVQANKSDLWRSARRYADGEINLDTLILDYLAIPGLGIVKASFLAQMTVGNGACLDTHNLRSLGLALDAFKTPKTLKVDSVRKRIATYNATWQNQGDSAHWWNLWCDSVGSRTHNSRGAHLNGLFYGGGAEVSALHRLAITAGIK